MFFAGLDIEPALFRRARNRSITFGITTTVIPLVLGTAVGLTFDYAAIPAIVIGSLLASHTLLGLTALDKFGIKGLEPVTVTVGATVMSDTLSLVVFAICVSIYTTLLRIHAHAVAGGDIDGAGPRSMSRRTVPRSAADKPRYAAELNFSTDAQSISIPKPGASVRCTMPSFTWAPPR
jgi:Sodium/hydrogen exchanger family